VIQGLFQGFSRANTATARLFALALRQVQATLAARWRMMNPLISGFAGSTELFSRDPLGERSRRPQGRRTRSPSGSRLNVRLNPGKPGLPNKKNLDAAEIPADVEAWKYFCTGDFCTGDRCEFGSRMAKEEPIDSMPLLVPSYLRTYFSEVARQLCFWLTKSMGQRWGS